MKDHKYWKTRMEASPEDALEQAPDDIDPLEEMVYPYSLTESMVKTYEDPAHNRDYSVDIYREILLKLLRSCKYWRFATPKWLPQRLRSLGAL